MPQLFFCYSAIGMKKSVEITAIIKAPIDKVWDALTTPEIIKQYFFGTHLTTDWKEGSPMYFQGEFQGIKYEDKGVVKKFTPKKHITYSYWSVFSGQPDQPENYQLVSYDLNEVEGGTEIVVKQSNLKEDTETHKDHVRANWKMVLEGLKQLVEGD